jgi:hypothetical protein
MRENAKQNNASKRHDRSTDAPLYPDEAEIARRVLGERAQEWPGKVAVLERDGLPKIDPLMGGGFWPAVRQWLLDRHGPMGSCLAARPCLQRPEFGSFPSRRTGRSSSMARKREPLVVNGDTVEY